MSSDIRFRINRPRVVYEVMDDEVVIIDFDTGNYYSLEKVAADIWAMIEAGASLPEMVEALTGRYAGDSTVIDSAARQFVAQLQSEQLIMADHTRGPATVGELKVGAGAPTGGQRPSFGAPVLSKYSDMQELLLLDPIHEVDEAGWPVIPQSSDESP